MAYMPTEDGWQALYMRFSPAGVDTSAYQRNNVLLFMHGLGARYPIGTAETFLEGGVLKARLQFHEETEESRTVARLWDMNVLNAVSKSVYPNWEAAQVNLDEVEVFLPESELIEISVVDIPADREAVREFAVSSGMSYEEADKTIANLRSRLTEATTMAVEETLIEEVAQEQPEEQLAGASLVDDVLEHVMAELASESSMTELGIALGVPELLARIEQLEQLTAKQANVIENMTRYVGHLAGEPQVRQSASLSFQKPAYLRQDQPATPPEGIQAPEQPAKVRNRLAERTERRIGWLNRTQRPQR